MLQALVIGSLIIGGGSLLANLGIGEWATRKSQEIADENAMLQGAIKMGQCLTSAPGAIKV